MIDYPKIMIKILYFSLLITIVDSLEMEKFRPIKADIALAIDTAVGDADRSPEMLDVEVIQHFLRKITTAFPLSPEDSRLAIVEFASSARVRLSLADGIDRKAIDDVYDEASDWYDEEGIDRQGCVNYSAMFHRVYDQVFTAAEGDRPDAPNLLVVLTMVPSTEDEDPTRWRNRARKAVRGSDYNVSDPVGTVVTTGYATQRGTHLPKFTMTLGIGTFEPDAWFYQDFNDILHYAVVHLRHATRSAWVDAFYAEKQMRQVRTFDYTTCRIDPAFAYKMPSVDEYDSFAADVVFAIEIDRSVPTSHHDMLRTFVLNMTRYLPISPTSMRFSAAEFDRDGLCRILVNNCPYNQTFLFKSLIEKWAPQSSPRYRSLLQESTKDNVRIDGSASGGNLINLQMLSKSLQKTLNISGRIPQVHFVTIVFLQTISPNLDVWFRRFLRLNVGNLDGGADAFIITNGNTNNTTYTVAISPLLTSGSLEIETSNFEDVRGKIFTFVINVTKAAVRRCTRCYYDASRRCVIDVRPKWRNASGIRFIDGRFCQNTSTSGGSNRCLNELVCMKECDRRPWSEWGYCRPNIWNMNWTSVQKRFRVAIDKNDSDVVFYRYCPLQKKRCYATWAISFIVVVPCLMALFLG